MPFKNISFAIFCLSRVLFFNFNFMQLIKSCLLKLGLWPIGRTFVQERAKVSYALFRLIPFMMGPGSGLDEKSTTQTLQHRGFDSFRKCIISKSQQPILLDQFQIRQMIMKTYLTACTNQFHQRHPHSSMRSFQKTLAMRKTFAIRTACTNNYFSLCYDFY